MIKLALIGLAGVGLMQAAEIQEKSSVLSGPMLQIDDCGYLSGYDAIYKRFGKLKIVVPKDEFVLARIQKSPKEQKPDMTASEFQSLLGRILKAKIHGVTSETTYDQIWIILCYNNIRIHKDKDHSDIFILEAYREV